MGGVLAVGLWEHWVLEGRPGVQPRVWLGLPQGPSKVWVGVAGA